MPMRTTDDAKNTKRQHVKPCDDCPWRRKSIPGWLGGHTATDFVLMAQGEAKYMCHAHPNQQCAGMAIYRANTCKSPRDKTILRLPADKKVVFDWPTDFMEHHKGYVNGEEDEEL